MVHYLTAWQSVRACTRQTHCSEGPSTILSHQSWSVVHFCAKICMLKVEWGCTSSLHSCLSWVATVSHPGVCVCLHLTVCELTTCEPVTLCLYCEDFCLAFPLQHRHAEQLAECKNGNYNKCQAITIKTNTPGSNKALENKVWLRIQRTQMLVLRFIVIFGFWLQYIIRLCVGRFKSKISNSAVLGSSGTGDELEHGVGSVGKGGAISPGARPEGHEHLVAWYLWQHTICFPPCLHQFVNCLGI